MNPILLVIIMIGGILILAYQITKNRLLNSLNRALTANDKEAINRITDKSLNQRILSPYVCDLYMLRVLFKTGQIEELKEHLNLVLDKPYTLEKRKDILDIYYYQFLFKDDAEYAEILLDRIRETNDAAYIEYNTNAYKVMILKHTDLLEDMIQGIDDKKYHGFALGITLYLAALQYYYLNDMENARIFFYNSLSCFHAKSIYAAHAQAWVDKLSKDMNAADLDYLNMQ